MTDLIQVPDDVKPGEVLTVFLDHFIMIPVRDEKGQQAQMPAYPCIENAAFKSQDATTLVVRTEKPSIFGQPGEKFIPKKKIAGIERRTGGISLVPPGTRLSS